MLKTQLTVNDLQALFGQNEVSQGPLPNLNGDLGSTFTRTYAVLEDLCSFAASEAKLDWITNPPSAKSVITSLQTKLRGLTRCSGEDSVQSKFEGYTDYLEEVIRAVVPNPVEPILAKLSKRQVSPAMLEDTILVRDYAVSMRCFLNCLHCCSPAGPDGPMMDFDVFTESLQKLRFPMMGSVSISLGEPLTYESGDKDLVDVVEELLKVGTLVGVVTSTFGRPFKRVLSIFERLESLYKKTGLVAVQCSYDLFRPLARHNLEAYIKRMAHLINNFEVIDGLKITSHEANNNATNDAVTQLKKRVAEERWKKLNLFYTTMCPTRNGEALLKEHGGRDFHNESWRRSGKLRFWEGTVPEMYAGFTVQADGLVTHQTYQETDIIVPFGLIHLHTAKEIRDGFGEATALYRKLKYEDSKTTVQALSELREHQKELLGL